MATNVGASPGKSPGHTDLPDAKQQVVEEAANELVFAVVGHIGSGTSEVARSFSLLLSGRRPSPIQTTILKAREVIEFWAKASGKPFPSRDEIPSIKTADAWQNLGDDMRRVTGDHAAVARGLIKRVREARASSSKLRR